MCLQQLLIIFTFLTALCAEMKEFSNSHFKALYLVKEQLVHMLLLNTRKQNLQANSRSACQFLVYQSGRTTRVLSFESNCHIWA